MKLLHVSEATLASTLTAPTLPLSLESYLAHVQIEPLTELMIEIITFQLREQALFADVELSASCLN